MEIEYRHGSNCAGCGTYIEWIKTTGGKMMPVDPKKLTIITARGNVVKGFLPHWTSCPKADSFRKKV